MPNTTMVAVLFLPLLNRAVRDSSNVECIYKVTVPSHDVEHFLVWGLMSRGPQWAI